MERTERLKTVLKETAQTLKDSDRRRFMAKTIEQLGSGGQGLAEREWGDAGVLFLEVPYKHIHLKQITEGEAAGHWFRLMGKSAETPLRREFRRPTSDMTVSLIYQGF